MNTRFTDMSYIIANFNSTIEKTPFARPRVCQWRRCLSLLKGTVLRPRPTCHLLVRDGARKRKQTVVGIGGRPVGVVAGEAFPRKLGGRQSPPQIFISQ